MHWMAIDEYILTINSENIILFYENIKYYNFKVVWVNILNVNKEKLKWQTGILKN